MDEIMFPFVIKTATIKEILEYISGTHFIIKIMSDLLNNLSKRRHFTILY